MQKEPHNQQQPNFTSIFREHFSSSEKVFYRVRTSPNILHDVVFVTSLIHDARLTPNTVRLDETTLILPIDRDRWEVFDSNEILSCQSVLTITGVIRTNWVGVVDLNKELWADYLWLDEAYQDHDRTSFEFAIVGEDWRLRIEVDNREWQFSLRDV